MFYTNSKIVITKNDAVRVSDTLLPGFNSVVIATHVLTDEQVDAAVNKSQYSENVKKYYANPEHRNAVLVYCPDAVFDADFAAGDETVAMFGIEQTGRFFITTAMDITLLGMHNVADLKKTESDLLKAIKDDTII